MAILMKMPALLADATEAVLSKWLVKEGESFTAGQALAEVETEKALVEVPAESDGILGKHLIQEGKSAPVGKPIAALLEKGESLSALDTLVSEEAATSAAVATPQPSANEIERKLAVPEIRTQRIFASPIARKLAREMQIDLNSIVGTGPDGRIVKADIFAAAKGGSLPLGKQEVSQLASAESIPHSRMRRAIARRLSESKQQVPHFYLSAALLADDFLKLRKNLNEWAEQKVSVTDLILKTVAAAYGDVPKANCTWGEEAISYFKTVDIAVAVATENGLVTPVVRGVENISLRQLAKSSSELFTRARDGKLKQDEIQGGTISVTNLGMYGTDEFYAILNPPQSMILAVGAAKKRAVVKDDQLAVATVINFTLSVDHRSIDGALAAEWLAAFSKRFENPMWLVN